MAWVYLILAGLFEVSWPTGFKMAQVNPEHNVAWVVFSAVGMTISGFLLYLAQRTIPIGAAYAAWAGVGAVGTFLLGIYYFNDTATLLSWFGIVLIVGGIVCLKIS
ncbi:MAG: DMT family transporter [Alphaproteobacteria bacterium]